MTENQPDNQTVEQPKSAPQQPEAAPKSPEPSGQDSWSSEKQAENTRKLQDHAVWTKKAADAGYGDDVGAYMADLENQNLELANRISSTPPETPPPVETPKALPVTQPKLPDDLPTRDDLRQLQAAHLKTAMTVDWREFKTDQKELPEPDKFGFTKKELDAILGDPIYSAAISAKYRKQMEEAGEANFYALAAETKVVVGGKAKVKKEGAEQQANLTKAEQAASLATSTAPPAPEGKPDDNQKLADDIIPDDPTYEYSG